MPAHWPPQDIRLTVANLVLRPMTEADLTELAAVRPRDMEEDPTLATFPGVPGPDIAAAQSYWRALGGWRPDDWRLPFVAVRAGAIIGAQDLEGTDYARLRTVDSSSWVAHGHRGSGVGKAMRTAILALAFEHLGASYAISSAWSDNGPSLGVSRALGYTDNGVIRHARGDGADDMVHLRLTRATWETRHAGRHGVTVDGFAGCEVYFGL
jgi:RimJ/RimL family protein N-acetyltransferase